MKISKELKAGIIVIVAIGLFIYGFNFLKGIDLFSTQREFNAVYSNIDGLVEANPVQINGFKVGQVRKLEFLPDQSGKIIVTLVINEGEIVIPKNSIAKIISSDLLGSKAIEINLGNSKVEAQNGDTLNSDVQATLADEVNKQVKPLKDKAEKLISSIDSVMVVVQAVFNAEARENITKSFESIKRSILTFENTSRTLDTMVTSESHKLSTIFSKIESISTNIANNNDKLVNIINNFSNISDTLAKANIIKTIDNTNKALADASIVIDKINKGEGSVGMLINDKKLYNQLDSASVALTSLLTDIEKNPRRYISLFGRKGKK